MIDIKALQKDFDLVSTALLRKGVDEKALEHFIDSIDLPKVAELLALKKKENRK